MTKDEKEKINQEAEEKMKKLLGEETVKAIQNSRHFSWLLAF